MAHKLHGDSEVHNNCQLATNQQNKLQEYCFHYIMKNTSNDTKDNLLILAHGLLVFFLTVLNFTNNFDYLLYFKKQEVDTLNDN